MYAPESRQEPVEDQPLAAMASSTGRRKVEAHHQRYRTRRTVQERKKNVSLYIGSIGTDAATFAGAVRAHWGIENRLHWSLDMAFREDESRVRDDIARENLAVLRHIALNRLKNDNTKLGIQNKRLRAGWDERYLAQLLFEPPDLPRKHPASATANIS